MQFKVYTIHVTSQSVFCVITPSVLRASHPFFVWHHTRHRYSIFCTIEDITSSLYEIKPPFLWHHTHYIFQRIDAISVTISTVLMISHQLSLWDLILYICWHHIHCIQKHIHYICTITATVPVSHIQSFHDITPFVWYHTKIYDISPTIFDTTATASVWSHQLYWCHHKTYGSHYIWHTYDIIHSVYHISFTLYDINPQYLWHHKHCIHDIRSPLYDITSTL